MPLSAMTQFRGRIFQVIDALDYGDAVSNQALAIDRMLSAMGFETAIYCKWFYESMERFCRPLGDLQPQESDIVILHFAGYSEFALPYVENLRCTKVCDYHNITPHTFFDPSTDIHRFCLKGREQLPRVVAGFHFFWGDSQYNLDELIAAGAPRDRCSVLPIVVDEETGPPPVAKQREPGSWMFLGRVVANKAQVNVVRMFARVREQNPALAQRLYIAGNIHETEPYARELRAAIAQASLEDHVVITGKVSDDEVDRLLGLASIYVSMSEHEGFGAPLIEAAHHALPVVALSNTAVGETLGGSAGLCASADEIYATVLEVLGSEPRRAALLAEQRRNSRRFTRAAVETALLDALKALLPLPHQFKTVSVVVCTYNRSSLLDRCLDYLQYQTNQAFEVVVINGPSSDDTETVIARFASRIKVGRNPEANLSKSRNLGIEMSSGDLIAFIDDDALPFDDWVDTLLREFNQRPLTLGALGGPAYLAGTLEFQSEDIGINAKAEAWINIPAAEVGRNGWVRSLLGTNTCFRADVLRAERGFDEQFDYFLDESELCFRLQQRRWLAGYCDDLYLRHEFAQSGNRKGGYKFNWFSICKNTAYFVAAYSGLHGLALTDYLARRVHEERIKPLDAAQAVGEITAAERDAHVSSIRRGIEQGLQDAAAYPRTRPLHQSAEVFLPFGPAAGSPLIGRDIRRLHICIVTKEFPPFSGQGGIGTMYYHLATELLQMGHHVTVVTPGTRENAHTRGRFQVVFGKWPQICVSDVESPGFAANLNWGLSAMHELAEVHSAHPVDIVECALWDYETLPLALLPRRERPALFVRLVTPFATAASNNGWTVAEKERALFMRGERTLLDEADAVLAISQSIAQTIESEHHLRRDRRWHLAPCGIAYWPSFDFSRDYERLTMIKGQAFELPAGVRMLLFVGRLELRKGVDVLLKAAETFLAADPTVCLVLAGRDTDGWAKRLPELLSPALAARVRILGEVDVGTREKLLHAAHAVVFPSRYESFGLVPLEAFVHGTPVIAARGGAIPEVVAQDQCGLLYDPEDAAGLAACVQQLFGDKALHARLVEGAYECVRRFSSRRSGIQAVELYRDTLGASAAP